MTLAQCCGATCALPIASSDATGGRRLGAADRRASRRARTDPGRDRLREPPPNQVLGRQQLRVRAVAGSSGTPESGANMRAWNAVGVVHRFDALPDDVILRSVAQRKA
jgi:hypothetical protein